MLAQPCCRTLALVNRVMVVSLVFALTLMHGVVVDAKGPRPSLARGKLITIGLVADSHYDTFPAGEKAPWEPLPHWFKGQIQRTTTQTKRRYDIAKDKMDESVDVFNRIPDMTLVVNLGDIVNNDMMWNLKPILDSFNQARAPKYHLLGNHDLRAHNDRFGKLNRTQADWVRNKFGLQEWYYALDHPPFMFIFLDSMVLEPESNDIKKKKEHMEWFQAKLMEAKEKSRVVILFAHIPIGFQTNVLAPILKTYDHIALAFFGHDHKGGYLIQAKTHCVTLNGQIETMINAFAVVDVFTDRAEMTGFGRVPTRIMSFTPETTAILQAYDGPVSHDLTLQGNQPLPPKALWEGETLQKPPPLQLNIPTYRKPLLPPTEPNPGDTQFLKETYSFWPKRVRTPSPEEPVDLTSAIKDKPPTILAPDASAPAAGGSGAVRPSVVVDADDEFSEAVAPQQLQNGGNSAVVASDPSEFEPRSIGPSRAALQGAQETAALEKSVFVFGYLMVLPVVLTAGGAVLLLVKRRSKSAKGIAISSSSGTAGGGVIL